MQVRQSRHSCPRSGVSLLEVVFSIGVVMIGLVGIAALLPLAGLLANKGSTADRAAQLGMRAMHDFQVRGMAQPRSWRWYNATSSQFVTVQPVAGRSFCLDPRFLGAGALTSDWAGRNRFPFNNNFDPTILAMPRITLAPSLTAGNNAAMELAQADEIFLSPDPLIFERPGDRTVMPVQNFTWITGATPTVRKRQAKPTISWIATLVPKLDLRGNVTTEYTLSVVVFRRRVLDPDVTNENVASERVVRVITTLGPPVITDFFSGNPALGGGDMQLSTRVGRPVEDLNVREGQWVMLSRLKMTTAGSTVQVHKWYRVVAVEEEPRPNGNFWQRDVTLVGPDWDWDPTGTLPTQVTIIDGVVSVLERTVRLETSSLWTY